MKEIGTCGECVQAIKSNVDCFIKCEKRDEKEVVSFGCIYWEKKEKQLLQPLPCPFCGKFPLIEKDGSGFIIYCDNDYCVIGGTDFAWFATQDRAIEAWNKRT